MELNTATPTRASRSRVALRPVLYDPYNAGGLLAPVLRRDPRAICEAFSRGRLPAADLGHGEPGRERRLPMVAAATIDRTALDGAAALHRAPDFTEIRAGLAAYPEVMGPSDVGQALGGLTPWTVHRMMDRGHMPSVRTAAGRTVRRSVLARWLYETIRDSMKAWSEARAKS